MAILIGVVLVCAAAFALVVLAVWDTICVLRHAVGMERALHETVTRVPSTIVKDGRTVGYDSRGELCYYD